LKPGDVLGLIGPSASGKSTLARALVGIWPLAGGEVRLDGAMMDQWDREKLGRFIGYLPQDVELFGGTVRQNIARFAEDADDEKVIEAAKWAGVHEMILKLPEGYDTILGELGSNLSAGQRQRVALARAIYGDPVLVVLDEPNSNLDAAGDAALIKAVRGMGERGQTVILIAHRPAALAAVDYILVLEGGMQKAFGPRDEILQQLAAARQQAMPQAPQAAPPGPQQAAPPVVTGGPS
ncbi:MAG TPA: ATP-binding cassette domain-containing protein, partial [Rhizobiales bacterium]|nr:ATP-binding cassette domain-containing protein [Hyphomicrobiales bacterium]